MSTLSGISRIGIQAVNGKTRTSQRSRPREWRDDEDASGNDSREGIDTEATATPQPSSVGRLVDKSV